MQCPHVVCYKEGYGRVQAVGVGHDQKLGYLLLRKKDLFPMSVVMRQEAIVAFN